MASGWWRRSVTEGFVVVHHLSAEPLGGRVALRPRVPRDRMPFENRSVRRVCVASTVEGCLKALRGCFYNRGVWHHYVTAVPRDLLAEPVGVPDVHLTGELWLLEPTEFEYAGSL